MAQTIKPLSRRPPLVFKYTDGKGRKMISLRLPEALLDVLKAHSEETGHSFTELVQYALDQFAQIQSKSK